MDPEQAARMYAELAGQYASQINRSPEDERRYMAAMDMLIRERETAQGRMDRDDWAEYIKPHLPKEREKMTTPFTIDLDNNSFTFGSVAKGQVTNLLSKLQFGTGLNGVNGTINGDFVGDIKAQNVIPITIPHKKINTVGYNIMVVGAGGTGGYLIRDLARFIFALREKGDTRQFTISIIDGDEVEKKNVLRQNFMGRDIGKKKADILAKRYANAFGIEIQSITQMADYDLLRELHNSTRSPNGNTIQNIVVGCVDNHAARREMNKYATSTDSYWIDSGNETKSGQVVIGYGNYRNSSNNYGSYRSPGRNTAFSMPNVIDLYSEIGDSKQDVVEDKKESCAERAMVDTQNIFVNMTAAGHVLSFIRQVVMQEPITINTLEFNIKGITNAKHLTKEYLKTTFDQVRNRG